MASSFAVGLELAVADKELDSNVVVGIVEPAGGSSAGHKPHCDRFWSQYTSTSKFLNSIARRFDKHFWNAWSSYWPLAKHAARKDILGATWKFTGTRRPTSRWV
jgi:hypothetical protein